MTEGSAFVDLYDILHVDPGCDDKTLEAAYRFLAKLYHPDRKETADSEKFNAVIEAYRQLRDVDRRAEYDALYAEHGRYRHSQRFRDSRAASPDQSAVGDAAAHARILRFLYDSRRKNAQNAGVAGFYVREMLGCSDEQFEFYRWYLLAKGYIETNEQGGLAITVDGVDKIIADSRQAVEEMRLIAQAAPPGD
jgi:curved DNA-binding protein